MIEFIAKFITFKRLRILVVLAVLYLAYTWGQEADERKLFLVLAIFLGLGIMRWPGWGIIGLIVAALYVPFAIGTGTQTSLNVAFLVVPVEVAAWLVGMVTRRQFKLVPARANLPALLFVVGAVISYLVGNLTWNFFIEGASTFAQLGGLMIYLSSVGVFWLIGNQVKEDIWLKRGVFIFLAGGGVYIAGRVLSALSGVKALGGLVSFGADGSLLWVWIVALAGGQILFNKSLRLRWQLACIALVVATLGVGWVNRTWASGVWPGVVALWVLLWLRDWKLGIAVTLVGAVVLVFIRADLVQSLITGDQYSISTRYVAAQVILENIVKISPVLGLGPSNYYHYTPLYPILGYYVQFNSHNQYIDIIAQFGVVGLAAFTWMMVAIGVTGLKLRRLVKLDFRAAYVNACIAGLVGSVAAGFLGDWFLPFVYNIGIAGFRASMFGWLFPGGLVAIEQMVSPKTQPEKPTVN